MAGGYALPDTPTFTHPTESRSSWSGADAGEVTTTLGRLIEQAEALHDRFGVLESRLGSVLRPVYDGDKCKAEDALKAVPASSALADALADLFDAYGHLEERIVALAGRVDL